MDSSGGRRNNPGGSFEPDNIGQKYPRDAATAAEATRMRRVVEPTFGEYATLRDLISDKDSAIESQNILQRVHPGDVFYYGDNARKLDHIAIVLSVDYTEDDRVPLANIRLIEATYSYSTEVRRRLSRVINFRNIGENYPVTNWRIVRLRLSVN